MTPDELKQAAADIDALSRAALTPWPPNGRTILGATTMPRKFLAPRASAGDGFGYRSIPLRRLPARSETDPLAYDSELVDQAERVGAASTMADEPECCSDDLADYAATAAFWRSQRHTAEVLAMQQIRPLLRAEDRLRDAQRRAKQAKRRDLKGEFVALQGMLARYQRVDGEPKPGSSVLNRLEGVEAKLDGVDWEAA